MYTLYETEVYARDRQQRLMQQAERERLMKLVRQSRAKNGRGKGSKRAKKILSKLIANVQGALNSRSGMEDNVPVSC